MPFIYFKKYIYKSIQEYYSTSIRTQYGQIGNVPSASQLKTNKYPDKKIKQLLEVCNSLNLSSLIEWIWAHFEIQFSSFYCMFLQIQCDGQHLKRQNAFHYTASRICWRQRLGCKAPLLVKICTHVDSICWSRVVAQFILLCDTLEAPCTLQTIRPIYSGCIRFSKAHFLLLFHSLVVTSTLNRICHISSSCIRFFITVPGNWLTMPHCSCGKCFSERRDALWREWDNWGEYLSKRWRIRDKETTEKTIRSLNHSLSKSLTTYKKYLVALTKRLQVLWGEMHDVQTCGAWNEGKIYCNNLPKCGRIGGCKRSACVSSTRTRSRHSSSSSHRASHCSCAQRRHGHLDRDRVEFQKYKAYVAKLRVVLKIVDHAMKRFKEQSVHK